MDDQKEAVICKKKGPSTSSTLTTVTVFWPLVFVEGMIGSYLGIFSNVVYSLTSSLFVALVLIPCLSFGVWKKRKERMG